MKFAIRNQRKRFEVHNRNLSRILADQFFQCRFRHGGTQVEVAKAAGISRSTLSSLESGLGNPSLALTVKMAEFYKIKIDDLIWDPLNQKKIRYRQGQFIQSQASELVSVRQIVSHRQQIRIREFAITQGRRLRLKAGDREWRELLICQRGQVSVSGLCRSETLKPGQFFELVPEVEKKVWAIEGALVTLIQVKS